ncbi:MAG: hypothetical protein ACI9Z3_001073 [Roseivirga sp.]|jgi:hypothetical protein
MNSPLRIHSTIKVLFELGRRVFSKILCLVFLISILIISSCDNSERDCESLIGLTTIKETSNLDYGLSSLKIPVPDTILYKHFLFDVLAVNGDLNYVGYNNQSNRLELFDGNWFVSQSFDREISAKVSALTYHSTDSIFIVTEMPQKLYLINDLGEIINNWDVSKPFDSITDEYFYLASDNNSKVKNIGDGKLLVSLTRFDLQTANYEKEPGFLAVYDINESSWVGKPFGDMPDIYTKGEYPRDFSIPDVTIANDAIVVSFPLSSQVDFYDKNTFELTKSLCVKSKEVPLNNKIIKGDEIQEEGNYLITEPFFSGLHFDSALDVYYRFYFEEQPLLKLNGELNEFRFRKAKLIKLDVDNSTIVVYPFEHENTIYFMSKFGSSKEGQILIAFSNDGGETTLHLSELNINEK